MLGHARPPRLLLLLALAPLVAWPAEALAQSDPPAGAAPLPAARPNLTQPAPAADTRAPEPEPQPTTGAAAATPTAVRRSPADGSIAPTPDAIFSDDWWGRARPTLELHGYFRTRGEVLHDFYLGRHDAPGSAQFFWGQPIDHSYTAAGADVGGAGHGVLLCNDNKDGNCDDKTQSGANMRFRLSPELHISDNLRIISQIDALDNLVLGSTPEAYAIRPSSTSPNDSGYGSAGFNPQAPLGVLSMTQGPPTAGVNGYRNSIDVKRAWAEYQSPVGQVRFGRMPNHWGLGMLHNGGDTLDSDYQSTSDRIMFLSGVKSLDLSFGGMWDFVSTGATSGSPYDVYGGQPYNRGNLTNVDQWGAFVARRTNPELQRLKLAQGDVVVNGGLFTLFRKQLLDVTAGETPVTQSFIKSTVANNGLERRGASMLIPDLWVQVLWKKFRFETEFAAMYGEIEGSPARDDVHDPVKIRSYGLTTQTEYRAIEDKLRLQFGFGWASGDAEETSLNPSSITARQSGTSAMSTFRFHQDYRVDLIFWRRIMTRVEGAYYFRPSVDYDFVRSADGQRLGAGAAIIWSRASEFVQTPGHKRDLGIELDLQLYYQAKDGTLNDDPNKTGGFFGMIQYGVFFPLGGLSYLPNQKTNTLDNWDTASAHTLRLFLGVAY
jgi:uncharacterized protein (TIGR04551 family)